MSIQFTIDTRDFERAAAMYAERKGKSDADVVNKAMRYLLPFAASRVRRKTKGGGFIRRQLTNLPRRLSRGRNKAQNQLANTLAAAIIAARMKKKGHVLPSRKGADSIDQRRISFFYDEVTRFVNSRVRSANFLRAGFIPAYRMFNVPGDGVPGAWRHKGHSKGIKAVPSLTKTVEAFASNRREGAYAIAPTAFSDALPEVTRQFLKWLEQDTIEQGRRSGFT